MDEVTGKNENEMNAQQQDAIAQLADQIKTGDDALNKLKVQNLDFILDIPLKVSVELGRVQVIIKDLLQLGQGSVHLKCWLMASWLLAARLLLLMKSLE